MSDQLPQPAPEVAPFTFKELSNFAKSGFPPDGDVARLLQSALVLQGSVMGITRMLEEERKHAQLHVDSLAVLTKKAGSRLVVDLNGLKNLRTTNFKSRYDQVHHSAIYFFGAPGAAETSPGGIILPG